MLLYNIFIKRLTLKIRNIYIKIRIPLYNYLKNSKFILAYSILNIELVII